MRSKLRDERGAAVTVWTVLMVTVVMLMVGIAVDLSGQVVAKRQAGDVAAQAARAGAEQVDQSAYLSTGLEVAAAKAKASAAAYAQASGMQAAVRVENGSELVVDVTATYRPTFLSAFGVAAVDVTGSARTRVVRVQDGVER